MKTDDLTEAVGVLQSALTALQAAVPGDAGRFGAAFRYACGDLLAQAPMLLQAAAVGTPLQSCFDAAVTAGATLNGLVGVRSAVTGLALSGQPALYVAGGCYCLTMGSEAKVLATTTFTSSNDALTALSVFEAAIEVAEEWTADNSLPALYQSLIMLGAAASRDLMTRAAPLPRITTYAFPRGTTSHALAYRLYGDANRCNEMRMENKTIHPAFMPSSGTALSE